MMRLCKRLDPIVFHQFYLNPPSWYISSAVVSDSSKSQLCSPSLIKLGHVTMMIEMALKSIKFWFEILCVASELIHIIFQIFPGCF
jgi:hypothetical protein